jgi:uncharacterized iron-regulated membrane protein
VSSPLEQQPAQASAALQRYTAAWRWHFFAGIVVTPFLLVLATTGLVMLYYTVVQTPLGEQLVVHAGDQARTSPTRQLAAAQDALPGGTAAVFIPASAPDRPVQFELTRDDKVYTVDIDPYSNRVLRVVDKDSTLYALAHRIHGTLLLGETGDTIVEVVAGLALLMLATGVYMWLQQRTATATGKMQRSSWRRWHQRIGLYAAVLLCFFLLSGLAWTNVWGGKLVQPWNSFPAEKMGPVQQSGQSHSAMNHGAHKQVPWGLEQTPLPASSDIAEHDGHSGHAALDLDAVARMAREIGFGPRFRINLPQDASGVYTISSTSMSGEVDNPGDERTVHVDRHSGNIVAEARFADYSPLAKGMAVGVAAHQGSFGWWSIVLDVLACTVVIFLCISGTVMWWLRRPARRGWLPVPPPRRAALPLRSGLARPGLTVLLLALGIAFPLLGAALLAGLALMWTQLFFLKQKKPT